MTTPSQRVALRRRTNHDEARVEAPLNQDLSLPETILQFGTGAFLRGFVEDFVDRANRQGREAGRVVMVSSTGSGRAARLTEQDGLYTLCLRGLADGETVDRARVIASVSRALSAQDQWSEVLAFARSPHLRMVVSNTTEVGITLDENDRLDSDPPRSFPGKLTAVLYERARAFDYTPECGLVVLPCELIESNGEALQDIVLTLAEQWGLGDRFAQWVRRHNRFCNTLVDRIVPGKPDGGELEALYDRVGYADALLTVAEPYALWAIEGDGALRERLPFLDVHDGIVVTGDVTPYRKRKVRILNGAHTATVPTAFLCGCKTVREAVEDAQVGAFVRRLVLDEIVPSLDLDAAMANEFAHEVLERFANPFIRHELVDITFQQTAKMPVRVLPSVRAYVEKEGVLPPSLTFGFACFLLFQHEDYRPVDEALPTDDARAWWREQWQGVAPDDAGEVRALVAAVCADTERWGELLDALPGFVDVVTEHVVRIARDGARAALEEHLHAVA